MKTRDEFPDWFTKNQWLKKGYVVKRNHYGQELWCNRRYTNSTHYFSKKDVRHDEEKAKDILREQNKKAREQAKKRKIAIEKELELHDVWNTERQWYLLGRKPKPNAIWKLGSQLNNYCTQFGSDYWYCHEDDTEPINETKEE